MMKSRGQCRRRVRGKTNAQAYTQPSSDNLKGRDHLGDIMNDNIKTNFMEMGCEDWNNLAQDREPGFVVSTLMTFRVR